MKAHLESREARVSPRWNRASALLLLILPFVAAVPSHAQTGSLEVRVQDAETGGPLPGATVMLSSSAGLTAPAALLTPSDGVVLFPILRAGGGYRVEVSLPGFASVRRSDVRVRLGETNKLLFQMTVPTRETVQVLAQGDVVDLERVGQSTKFSAEFMEELPQEGRLYQNVLTKAPGVLDNDGDGNPNVHGARTRDFRAEVGGVSNVDPLTGRWLSYVNVDSIEELEVIPLGAGVEFGRAQGGFARVIQKQGTNEFEGVFNFLYRSSFLDRDGAGNPSTNLPLSEFETLQPSIQVSGPIIKDKLWYRLSHEYVRQEEPVNLLSSVAVTTTEQTISADQITWQVSPRNKLSFQYQHDPLRIEGLDLSSSTPLESSRTFERGGPTYSINWVAPISPSVLVDSVVAYQDHSHDFFATDPSAEQDCIFFSGIPAWRTARCTNFGTNQISGAYNESSFDSRQRFTAKTQATLFGRIGSHSHQLKLGMIVENERYFRELERGPEITLRQLSDRDFCRLVNPNDPFAACFPPPPFTRYYDITLRMFAPRVTPRTRATGNSWGLYLEDQWKPRPNLSVTFGLRYDREEIDAEGFEPLTPGVESRDYLQSLQDDSAGSAFQEVFTAPADIQAFREALASALDTSVSRFNFTGIYAQSGFWTKTRRTEGIHITNDNVAPRLALSWDPKGNGKTKLSLTAGRYYDKIFLGVPLVEHEPAEARVRRAASSSPFGPIFGPTQYEITPVSVRMVDRNLKTPYQDEFTIGIEREIFTETALRAHYVKRKFENQLQDIDINHLPGDHGFCEPEVFFGGANRFDPLVDWDVVPSEGTGDTRQDAFTGELYKDTDPGPGDGRLDDCSGGLTITTQPGGSRVLQSPDGKPDLFIQNPAWNELLLVGNFNTTDYEAFVLELVRRQYRSWQMQASYTWSRAKGDAEDFDLLLGNEQSLRVDESGFLDYDQRHVFQVNATTITPWGIRLGGALRWESGLPYSLLLAGPVGVQMPPAYPFQFGETFNNLRDTERLRYITGQRNDQRNASFWTLDGRISKELPLGGGSLMQLSLEVFNLLNDDTLVIENTTSGQIAGTRRFGRRFQLGLRVTF